MQKIACKRMLLGALLTLMLMLCTVGAACSSSASGSSGTTESKASSSAASSVTSPSEDSAEPSATDSQSPAKPDKNGFSESTNSVTTVAGVDFQIPAYFGEMDDKGSYYAETGQGITMLSVTEFDASGATGKDLENGTATFVQSYIKGISKNAEGASKPVFEDVNVTGLPSVAISLNITIKGIDINSRTVIFLNENAKKIGVLNLGQSTLSSSDYFADFDKIIASAVISEAKPSTPTLGSTIEYGGLAIELGTELLSTTLQNQFSDLDGATVLCLPVRITNNGSESTHLNMYAVKTFGSQGTELDSIFTFFDDDARMAGDMRPGASQEANLYFLYDGDGTYYLDFGFYKTEVEVEIPVKL